MINWINKKRNQKGFTLVELVVVIAILGILGGIAVPRFTKYQEEAKLAADEATVSTLNSAIGLYYATNDSSLDDFESVNSIVGDGGVIKKLEELDLIEEGTVLNYPDDWEFRKVDESDEKEYKQIHPKGSTESTGENDD